MLSIPNWSEGRHPNIGQLAREAIAAAGAQIHFSDPDPDHNRLVTAFSGSREAVRNALFRLCDAILPLIDLNHHTGAHPRIGALDVCPFVLQEQDAISEAEAVRYVDGIAAEFAEKYQIPVLLYEKSERGRHAKDLPTLRKGGFEAARDREIPADFGPNRAHPKWGVTIMGLRDPLLAVNAIVPMDQYELARSLARIIRTTRDTDPRFRGIRAIATQLPTQSIAQVSMNFTKPDETSVNEVIEWLVSRGAKVLRVELIGVVRASDLAKGGVLDYRPEQIVAP
jgi:glutamate formiminotransferase